MALQHLRSSTAHKRPIPTVMSAGQIAINTNEASPGLFFKDSNGDLVKVGPVHIGTTAPNSSPASVAATALVTGTVYQILTVGTSDFTLVGASANTVGTIFTATGTTTGTGTVSGQQGVEKGEQWLDTTGGAYDLKIYDGTDWRSQAGEFVNATGDTMTGDLVMNNANIVFEGATADDFETTLTVTDPTADRSIVLPDVSGDIVTTGDTGTVTSTMIADGTIVNADVNASAAIAGTKIDPDFGIQEVTNASNVNLGAATNATISLGNSTNTTAQVVKLGTASAGPVITVQSAGIGGGGATDKVRIVSDIFLGTNALYPSATLDKDGNIKVADGAAATPSIAFTDDTNTGIYRPSADQLAISTNGTAAVTVDSSQRVGIGTTSPGSYEAGKNNFVIANTGGNAGLTIASVSSGFGEIAFADGTAGSEKYRGQISYDHTNDALKLFTAASEALRIDSSGNVGIGTSSPDAKLETVDTASSLTYPLAISNFTDPATDVGAAVDFRLTTGGNSRGYIACRYTDNTAAGGTYLSFAPNDGSTGNVERMRIDSSGKVGIGTTSMDQLLHVQSSSSYAYVAIEGAASSDSGVNLKKNGSNEWFIFNDDSNSDALQIEGDGGANDQFLTVTQTGNVGIGTTSPDALLTAKASSGKIARFRTADTNFFGIDIGTNGSNYTFIESTKGGTGSYQPLAFFVGGNRAMDIDSSGRLLIGTSSARSNFYSNTPDLQVEANSGTARSRILIQTNINNFQGGELILGKSRGTTAGSNTIVQNNDELGLVLFAGLDGTDYAIGASVQAQVDGTPGANDMPGRLVFSTTADGASSPTERMRVDSSGRTIFANNTGSQVFPSATSFINDGGFGQILAFNNTYGGGKGYVTFYYNSTQVGSILASGSAGSTATGVSYNTTSDYRLKENVVDISDGIARVKLLQPKRFNFIVDAETTVDGFLAHEAQTVVPEAVTGTHNEVEVWKEIDQLPEGVSVGDDKLDEDGNTIPVMQGIDQSKLVPLLTAALQEAIAKIETLEQRLSDAGIA